MASSKVGLTKEAIKSAADRLSVKPSVVQAFTFVEAAGSGFLPSGHPKVLFERHKMYRAMSKKFSASVADHKAAQFPLLVNRKPGGYTTQLQEPNRLASASNIDRDCALESTSWGLFQIMGFHWEALGYSSLQEFVNAMYRSEVDHLDAFVRFVLADKRLVRALQDCDWPAVATIYNGPNYRKNKYDTKLAAAFKKFEEGQL